NGDGDGCHLDVDADRERYAAAHGAIRFPVGRRSELQGREIRMEKLPRQTGKCRRKVGLTMKTKNIVYWIITGLVAFFIGGGGCAQIAQYVANPHGVLPVIGYPSAF